MQPSLTGPGVIRRSYLNVRRVLGVLFSIERNLHPLKDRKSYTFLRYHQNRLSAWQHLLCLRSIRYTPSTILVLSLFAVACTVNLSIGTSAGGGFYDDRNRMPLVPTLSIGKPPNARTCVPPTTPEITVPCSRVFRPPRPGGSQHPCT